MILKTLFLALTGAAVWKFANTRRSRVEYRLRDRKPHAENRWESEGGALPHTGAQLGPEPSFVKSV